MESLYKLYKHGCNPKHLVKDYGLKRVFNSFKRNGLQVRLKNNRIQIWSDWYESCDIKHCYPKWVYLT
jgi:hypothetical protein